MAFDIFGRLRHLAAGRINSGRCFAGNAAILVLRRGDRHQELVDRHGRAGDDRGQNLGVFAPRSRPDERAGPERHGRHRGRRRGRGGRRRQEVPVYFQGALPNGGGRPAAAAPRYPREPAARLRRAQRHRTLCDEGSVLELRRAFGPGMVTALARIEGGPFGIVANNPMHSPARSIGRLGQGRALPAALRCLRPARPLPLRHAGHDGRAEVEKTALVRHCSRLFVIGANSACRSATSCAQGLWPGR